MYEIEKNVPLPDRTNGVGRRKKYPWDRMEIGDSFFVAANGKRLEALQNNVRCGAKRQDDKKFTTAMIRGEIPGVRVWRIA